MTQSMPTHDPPTLDPSSEQILWRLRQPLDMNRVKRRQAPGQGTVPYLEGFDVIEAANDLFLFRWSFDLLSEPHIMRWDKVVTFYDQRARKKVPVLGEDGKPTTEIAGVAYITGRITVELDGKAYNHADAGRCIFYGDYSRSPGHGHRRSGHRLPEALFPPARGAVRELAVRQGDCPHGRSGERRFEWARIERQRETRQIDEAGAEIHFSGTSNRDTAVPRWHCSRCDQRRRSGGVQHFQVCPPGAGPRLARSAARLDVQP